MEKPTEKQNVNWNDVAQLAKDYMEYLDSEDACEDTIGDYETPIFEAVIMAIYGDDVFKYINKRIDEF